jgi:hypothetical protein
VADLRVSRVSRQGGGMIKEAIANYINAKSERIRPCQHDWELIHRAEKSYHINPLNGFTEWTYRCKKCGKKNYINSEETK